MGDARLATPDLEAVLASLTLEEKISLLAGKNFWETVDIPEKGVPSVKVSDGPNGARGATFKGGPTAACFPASVLLASTWDIEAARSVGNALAEETRSKGARALLAPTVCLHRHVLGGRNFESFSEDPLLAGKMAAQYITGLQDHGVAATIKHYAANEQETCRFTVDTIVSERALREIYLKPFEIAVKEAQPWAVMTSYNLVNGLHSDMSPFLLQTVLRNQWGWDGLVMSDWGGTNSTSESIEAGMDLEMPGPTRWREVAAVVEAVKSGKLSAKAVDDGARNVLRFLARLNCFADPTTPPEQAINLPKHQKLIREVGSQGIVLLKNEGNILPLEKSRVSKTRVALLGLAREALIHGGGSASLNAHYRVTPEEGLKAALGDDVEFEYAQGAHTFRQLPLMLDNAVNLDGQPGWSLELFDGEDTSGTPSATRSAKEPTYMPIFLKEAYQSIKATSHYSPVENGSHYLALTSLGRSQLFVNGAQIYEQDFNCPDAMAFLLGGVREFKVQYSFEAGRTYKIEIRTVKPAKTGGFALFDGLMGFRLGFMRESEHHKDVLSEAIEVAERADVAIVFTGHSPDWETEGQDQLSFNLPADGSQDRLVSAVSGVNANTIVVNSTGVPIAMPWLGKVKAVVQAWFAGQEAGNAIADILTGAVNPSGRLPVSFPQALEDTPAHGHFPGEIVDGHLQVTYEEGVFIGYRHYDRSEANRNKVVFPFGYGLSYTSFAISNVTVQNVDDEILEVTADVTNTGSRYGTETVQVYAGTTFINDLNPVKELVGFAKEKLEPQQTKTAVIRFSKQQLSHFDESSNKWKLENGAYEISVGQSVKDIAAKRIISIAESKFYDV